jgi:site-specific DNA recombinase
LERFIVDRIQEMGSDPSLLQDTLNAVAAERQRDVPELTREQRQLQAEHQACRVEARQLITVLATMKASDGRSITQRLAELDERSAQIELRLTEIQETLAAVDRSVIQANDVAKALSLFVPVWQVLTPREQARVLRLLVETIDYDGKTKEVAITLRPTGIAMLVREVAESALAESAA